MSETPSSAPVSVHGSLQPQHLLRLEGLSKSFGNVNALTDVTLGIRPGEVLGLVGENGAGKSTLLRILQGDHRPDAGHLLINGHMARLSNPHDGRRLGIRVVHQEPEIVPGVSVAENLYLGELPHGRSRRIPRRRLTSMSQAHLDNLGFGNDVSATAIGDTLSTAQRQLVEIARALKPGVQVLALDEPTSSLTEDQVARLHVVIRRLRRDGASVLYVSHRLREVLSLADRVAVLRDGRLIEERDATGTTENDLVRLMVGRELTEVFPTRNPRSNTAAVVLAAKGINSEWLHDIDIDLRRGEIVGVAGLIGAGRSELAKTLFGDVRRTSGTIEIEGAPATIRSPRDAIRAGIGFAPEDRRAEALLSDRSVTENITICVLDRLRMLRVVKKRAQLQIATDLANKLRVKTPDLDQPVSSLSGGNAQKVVLARWLAVRPKVLILDEPTRGIDVGAKAEIYRLIRELADDGLAILFISSELPEVLGISDRIVVMREGRITGQLHPSEATEEGILVLAMLDQLDHEVSAS